MLNKKVNIIINCPHCNNLILIEELNCKIFRHDVIKETSNKLIHMQLN